MKKRLKILILGSGALKIGEAGEFDYSGSQAIKAVLEEGHEVILVNPNIATVQTDPEKNKKVYFIPVRPDYVEKVIHKERPNGIMLGFGGQTALNCGIELYKKGILKKYHVEVLGTPIEVINKTEDRNLFVRELNKIKVLTPKSIAANDIRSAIKAASNVGYPVIIRAGFALGGLGSGFASDQKKLKENLKIAFAHTSQVLIEEDLRGWKEIEYEIMRDTEDNCISVCNMENFDPLGVHTGESIVVSPSQTLSDAEYQMLRSLSIKVIRHFKIIGECNIQFALNPENSDYRVIEVNARLSRSSALASKVTGYPLAFVAAKISLGKKLTEVLNKVTRKTYACFEPALDYIAVKIPRWDFTKFAKVDEELGSKMKSVGEVMSIARSFPEALQKAVRMLHVGKYGLVLNKSRTETIIEDIKKPTPRRLFAISRALNKKVKINRIHKLSKIDKWFLFNINEIIEFRRNEEGKTIRKEALAEAKKLGYSDKQLSFLYNCDEDEIRLIRKKYNILPYYKHIDTLAAEFPSKTNYIFSTYNASSSDIKPADRIDNKKIIILGSGPYKIGSSVEFDWCCVNTAKYLKRSGYKVIMINNNPETVSTDFDICDKLYFDELSLERVLDIYEFEKPLGIIISMGGQIPNNLALKLHERGVRILGTSPISIDNCEDRHKFSYLLDSLSINQPTWHEFKSLGKAKQFAKKIGYPVLLRPSYVLSGTAMKVIYDDKSFNEYIKKYLNTSDINSIIVTKFEEGVKEIEFDGVAQRGNLIIYAISEHIENAGVHSGDATLVIPPQKLYFETFHQIKNISKALIRELNITGPFNIQYLARGNKVKVIECNLRASRSLPFVSKATGYDFIQFAVDSILGKNIKGDYKTLDLDYVVVKAPQFSFSRLSGADPVLGVEMSSTGEVASFGDTLNEAFLLSLISTGFRLPERKILITLGSIKEKVEFLQSARLLNKYGYKLYTTSNTHDFFLRNGVKSKKLYKISEKKTPNIYKYLEDRVFDLVINTPSPANKRSEDDGYIIRRKSVDFNIPLINNSKIALLFVNALVNSKNKEIDPKNWGYYLSNRDSVK